MPKTFAAALALLLFVTTPVTAQWRVRTNVDRFTDEETRFATTSGTGGEYGGLLGDPYIGLQCDEDGAAVYFETRATFLNVPGSSIRVLTKVDEGETRTFQFRTTPDGTGAHERCCAYTSADEQAEFSALISDMRAGNTLFLRAYDAMGAKHDFSFPLVGVTRATNALGCFTEEALAGGTGAERGPLTAPPTFEDDPIENLPAPDKEQGRDLAEAPTRTPMTVRPQLRNNAEVARALERTYPPLLREAGIGGTVNVWFFIDENGRVQRTLINESSGYDAFDEAALKVADLMEFTPAYNRDKRVAVWIAFDVTFEVRR